MKYSFTSLLFAVFSAMLVSAGDISSENSGESEITLLLGSNPGVDEKEILSFARRCEKTAARYPEAPQSIRLELYKLIGDTYFGLDEIRYARKWHRWYVRVANEDLEKAKGTPIAYRLEKYRSIGLRANLMLLTYGMFGLVFIIVLVGLVGSKGAFEGMLFLRRLLIFLGVYIISAAAVFAADAWFFHSSGARFVSDESECGCSDDERTVASVKPVPAFVRPTVPLSFIDTCNALPAARAVVLGFIPIAVCCFFFSFRGKAGKTVSLLVAVSSALAVWSWFFLTSVFDPALESRAALTPARVIFRGELEKIILENPHKVLRANPNLLKTKNVDLPIFIKTHFPENFPPERK